jgi:purine-binding chemotaxis protein CheW
MSDSGRYLCFHLGQEEFAIPLLLVKEVIGVPETTPVPQTPSYFVGIMNLRGQVLSVMDLRQKLGIKPTQSEEVAVVILDLGEAQIGLMVDRVNSVQMITKEQISEKPVLDGKNFEHITGVYRNADHLVLLLDVSKALSLNDKKIVNKPQTFKAA